MGRQGSEEQREYNLAWFRGALLMALLLLPRTQLCRPDKADSDGSKLPRNAP